jgi:hypothetical protein
MPVAETQAWPRNSTIRGQARRGAATSPALYQALEPTASSFRLPLTGALGQPSGLSHKSKNRKFGRYAC